MFTIKYSDSYLKWFTSLRDMVARARIIRRLERVERGNLGDIKFLGDEIWEMRFDFGPGYRIYYTVKDKCIYLLLVGGDKSSQQTDIARAKSILENNYE